MYDPFHEVRAFVHSLLAVPSAPIMSCKTCQGVRWEGVSVAQVLKGVQWITSVLTNRWRGGVGMRRDKKGSNRSVWNSSFNKGYVWLSTRKHFSTPNKTQLHLSSMDVSFYKSFPCAQTIKALCCFGVKSQTLAKQHFCQCSRQWLTFQPSVDVFALFILRTL